MCAIEAGRRNRRVLLLDHAEKAGKKILISGGGRCNFTNIHCRPENFLSQNPHLAKSAHARKTPADINALVEKQRIPYHEKTLGQSSSATTLHKAIFTMLERECAEANVTTLLGTRVLSLTRDASFRLETTAGIFEAQAVVIATGGLSIPKMGATDFGYQIAKQFGLRIAETRPALVPLVFNPHDRDRWCDLTGLSAEVIATVGSGKRKATFRDPVFREKMLITHRGLSGPAILQISSYWQPGETIQIDLAPGLNVMEPMLTPRAPVQSAARAQVFAPVRTLSRRDLDSVYDLLRTILPTRTWPSAGSSSKPTRQLDQLALAAAEQQLPTWSIEATAGAEGYARAEVTARGE